MASLKDSLTDVPSNVYTKDWKYRETNIGKLDSYLAANDCTAVKDQDGCYRETRLLLIATTKELDAANDQINALNQVVDRLMGNVNAIIDNFNADDDKKFDVKNLKKIVN